MKPSKGCKDSKHEKGESKGHEKKEESKSGKLPPGFKPFPKKK